MERLASMPPASVGIRVLVAIEVVTFGALMVAVWVLAAGPGDFGPNRPPLIALLMLAALGASAGALVLEARRVAAGLAVVFLGLTAFECSAAISSGLALGSSRLADSFYIVTGFHAVHVAIGAGVLAFMPKVGRSVCLWFWLPTCAAYVPVALTFHFL